MKELKVVRKPLTKEEVERMFKIAYYLDRSFFKPADMVNLGVDIYRLKECGEVKMSKRLAKLRPLASEFWGRMTDSMKAMFFWSYLCEGADSMKEILGEMEPIIQKSAVAQKSYIDSLLTAIASRLPGELQVKIREGFGREWASEEKAGIKYGR